jgi:prepilin-type N-terminal cleavage/methylation domain-containing protein
MYKQERGFSFIETLVALAVITTLLSFVVPLYLTGKSFTKGRILENQARMLAQSEIEKQLSDLKISKKIRSMKPFQIEEEVTRVQGLWNIQVKIKWKNTHGQIRSIKLEVYRYQNVDSPT